MSTKHIVLHDKAFRLMIENSRLEEAIDSVAAQLNRDFADAPTPPVLLCVLTGSIMFTSELMKRLDFNLEVLSMKLSSYQGTSSTGEIKEVMGLTGSVEGKTVIIIEDIVDTGNTIVELVDILKERGAADVKVCTMLLKPEVYHKSIKMDYVGMEIPPAFIVGFGLDYNELGRNYPDIYVLDPDYPVK